MHHQYLSDNWPQEQIRAHQFYHNGKLLTVGQIAARLEKAPISPWAYIIIAHYLKILDKSGQCSRPLTPFESLYIKTTPQSHLISYIHNLIFADLKANESQSCRKWEADLSIQLTEERWEQIFLNIHKGSTNVTTQENGFKIQARLYHTPVLLHKFKAVIPEMCWRCHQEKGTLLHIWWSCTPLRAFWSEVQRLITQVTTYKLEFTPAQFLLHLSSLPHATYHKSLMMHMINAAKQCIPVHWNSIHIPTIKEWFARINRVAEMEQLIHISRDTPTKFSRKWACWIHYQTLPEYKDMLTPPT